MPELPEIKHLAGQMDGELAGRRVSGFSCLQPKCLNTPPDHFAEAISGQRIQRVHSRGKWILVNLDGGSRIALNLGMGGDVAFLGCDGRPAKEPRVRLAFGDGSSLCVGFWWFGYFHHVGLGQPHSMTDGLGPEPTGSEFTPGLFRNLLSATGRAVKYVLLDQRTISGIGNYYIHDILWRAGVHPLAPASSLDGPGADRLYAAMRDELGNALMLGGAYYERDLYGRPGGCGPPAAGYREGQPCARCGTVIRKIRTGGTHSFICPFCQPR